MTNLFPKENYTVQRSSKHTGDQSGVSKGYNDSIFRKKVEEHEAVLNKKLNWLKEESKMLAQKRKDFIILKEKSEDIKDPNVHKAIQKTENELNQVRISLAASGF